MCFICLGFCVVFQLFVPFSFPFSLLFALSLCACCRFEQVKTWTHAYYTAGRVGRHHRAPFGRIRQPEDRGSGRHRDCNGRRTHPCRPRDDDEDSGEMSRHRTDDHSDADRYARVHDHGSGGHSHRTATGHRRSTLSRNVLSCLLTCWWPAARKWPKNLAITDLSVNHTK